ncbi:MAG: LppX_LprAFG lipoprotein, partial [Dehalococcoidia bacterium]|nr:LppX_LprAFG lipoprotein [Dehalococcoidia bacterium]
LPPDPKEILERSGRVMASLDTFNFRMYHDVGSLEILEGLLIEKVSGKIVNPDRLSMEFSGSFGGGFAIKSEVITVGDQTYMTNPLTGNWEASDASISPVGFFSPTRGIAEMMGQTQNATLLDDGASDGAYRISGALPTTALASLVGPTLTDRTVDLELTIDTTTDYLLEVRFTGAVTPSDVEDAERVIVLSFFNEEVVIEPPEDSS